MATGRSGRTRARKARRSQAPEKVSRSLKDLPYTRRNVKFLAAGIVTILIGYLCLAQPPVDGFLSLTLAPILLVIGYCVLIPIGLLIGGKKEPEGKPEEIGQTVGG
jgi:hypothetical protein